MHLEYLHQNILTAYLLPRQLLATARSQNNFQVCNLTTLLCTATYYVIKLLFFVHDRRVLSPARGEFEIIANVRKMAIHQPNSGPSS